MRRKGAHQPARRFAFASGFTRSIGESQESRRLAPPLIHTRQLRLVKFSNTIKLFELSMTFSDRLTHFVQPIGSHWQWNVLTLVTGQQQPHIHVVIEIVVPAFLKALANEFRSPEVTGLRRAISPRQTVRSRSRHHR